MRVPLIARPFAGVVDGEAREEYKAAVQRLLLAHRIPVTTARKLQTMAESVQVQAMQTGLEYAFSLDIETGQMAGEICPGAATEVDITEQIAAMNDHARYVSLHTHGGSTAFSDVDVDLLLRNRLIVTIAAVGADGTWHLLSKLPGVKTADATIAVAGLQRSIVRLSPIYLALAESGAATREEALQQMLHTIWQLVARPLGLRYDRSR